MSNILETAKKEVFSLEKKLAKVDHFLSQAPEGCLKWQNRKGKIYYYQQYRETKEETCGDEMQAIEKEAYIKDINPSRWNRRYITASNLAIAKALAKKHYYTLLKRVIQKKIYALKKFIHNYPSQEIETIYDEMCDERKILIEPIETTIKQKVKSWIEEGYETNTSYPENLRYETNQGEMVRSKSEVIIANILYQQQKNLLYKYEKPLKVIVNGKEKNVYPDFTMINIHTGKILYWEHAGRMDDPYYANEFVGKINTYITNGLLPGRDIILSFETQEKALDIKVVKELVKSLL